MKANIGPMTLNLNVVVGSPPVSAKRVTSRSVEFLADEFAVKCRRCSLFLNKEVKHFGGCPYDA